MLTPIPLSRFEGVLRQIAVEKLSSVEREVFQHVFPTFDETPTFSEPARVNMAHGRNVQTPYNYRRFAGGPELPRGCYSSVCNSEGTGDDGTLIHELLFYAKPDTTGEIYLLEGTDERLLGGEQSSLGRFSGYRPDPSSLVVAFVSRPGRLHPLLDPDAAPLDDRRAMREFRRTAPRSDQGVAILELPTTSRQVSLTSIFDLRRLSSQAWLNERARDEILFTAFYYSEPFEGLVEQNLRGWIPEDYPYALFYDPPDAVSRSVERSKRTASTSGLASKQLRLDAADTGTFSDLLSVLVGSARGGSPITEAMGAMFRHAGAKGLVYPSARNDTRSVCENDEVTAHSGWCFVDYSAFNLAWPCYRVIVDPIVWTARTRLDVYIRPEGEPDAGSWVLLGPAKRTQRVHAARIEEWYRSGHRKTRSGGWRNWLPRWRR